MAASTIRDECAVALYEARAEAFYRCTMMMAPGKDVPQAMACVERCAGTVRPGGERKREEKTS